MNDHQTVSRANQAQLVLENVAYIEAMQLLRDQITAEWMACPVRDKEGQTLLLQLAKLCNKFDGIFKGMLENGKVAQHRLDLDKIRDEPAHRVFMRRVISG